MLSEETGVPFNWIANGDEWIHHLVRILPDFTGSIGNSAGSGEIPSDPPIPYLAYRPSRCQVKSQLLIAPTVDSILLFVGFEPGKPDDSSQVEPWVKTVNEVFRSIGTYKEDLSWAAVVAPFAPGSHPKFASESRVAHLLLRPASNPYVSFERGIGSVSLYGGQVDWSWPIIVDGVSSGYNFDVAFREASKDVNRLCALLTAVYGFEWRVLQDPNPAEPGIFDVPLPPDSHRTGMIERDRAGWDKRRTEFVPWLTEAWSKLEGDASLLQSVHAFHQALTISDLAPSYALVALVSVVEGIGARYLEAERCDCCDSCEYIAGSGKRYRKALKLVLSNSQMKPLERLYTARSETAHAGVLHADEPLRGAFNPGSFFGPNPGIDFRWNSLRQLSSVAAQILVHELKNSS